jgi:hypothetical protein
MRIHSDIGMTTITITSTITTMLMATRTNMTTLTRTRRMCSLRNNTLRGGTRASTHTGRARTTCITGVVRRMRMPRA